MGTSTVGYEWDVDLDNGFRPGGLIDLSSTAVTVPEYVKDFGSRVGPVTATHHLTLFRSSGGGLVFDAGSVQWAWGLDTHHDGGGGPVDVNMQQATVNFLADMGAQPGSLATGLTVATASADHSAATSTISSPAAGAHVVDGTIATVTGTAADTGGGVVAGVEVSVDGTTWHPASLSTVASSTTWSYSWKVSSVPGPVTVKSRATDDSANLETPGAGQSLTVDAPNCMCSIFRATDAPGPQAAPDTAALEVGVKFRSDQAGYVSGVRFYKLAANTGTHIGTLWSSTGQKVAQATFTGETASGWQQVTFSAPVAVSANTTYVASYHSDNGGYASDLTTFGWAGADNWPLHALRNNADGGNGVFAYAALPTFPTGTFQAANYWVDLVFNTQSVDTVPPTVTGFAPAAGTANLGLDSTVNMTFSENMRPPPALAITVKDATGAIVDGTTAFNAGTLTATFKPSGPLELATTYTANVVGTDLAGNPIASPPTWSFSTSTCPCSFWNDTTTPAVASVNDPVAVEVGLHFSAQVDGYVTGIRFYKGAANIGTHIGHIWLGSDHSLLGTVTFAKETATGWQIASFSPPIHLSPKTDYVISYHTDAGEYAASNSYFASADTDVGPLLAKANASTAPNGVYSYGPTPGGFPTQTYGATNYWVDPVFSPTIAGAPALQILSQQETQVDQNNETIAWTTNKPSDSLVEYGITTSYGLKSTVNTIQLASHALQLGGLTPNTTYHYLIHTRDSAGAEAPGSDHTFLSAPVPDITPPVISNVQKIQLDSSTETISWTTDELADTQLDYGTTSSYGTRVLLDTTSRVISHSVPIKNLKPSTQYHFQITDRDSSNNAAVTTDDTFTTLDVQISQVAAHVATDPTGDTAAGVSWTTDSPADTQLDYGTTTSYGTTTPLIPDLVTSHTVNLTGLVAGTTYHYRVRSSAGGHTVVSGDNTFTTSDHVPPIITGILATAVDQNTETITWTTNKLSDTELDYGLTSTYTPPTIVLSPLVLMHSVTVTNLTPGTAYHYDVKSRDASPNKNLATSTDQTFTTIDTTPPQIPNTPGIQATSVTTTTATITWTTNEASDSTVKYGTTTGYGSSASNPSPVTSHSVALTGLLSGQLYHYQVLSKDPSGNLVTSTDRNFTTMAVVDTTPPVFGPIQVTTTTNSATITWATNEASDSQVAYGPTSSYGSQTTLDQSLVISHTVTITGLTPDWTYHYQLRSKDAAKNLGTTPDAAFTTAVTPRSLSLNGSSAYAEAPSALDTNVLGDWTIEAWFKDETPGGYFHMPTTILAKGDVVSDREIPFAIGIAFNSLFVAEKANNEFGYMYYDLDNVSPNAWHHVAVTMKASTRQATLYLDGVQVQQGTFAAITSAGNAKPVSIGRNGGPLAGAYWRGKLDDVRFWSGVRTASQISANYRAELTGAPTGLLANWRFDEGSGTTASDTGSIPQNATLYGGAGWSTDVHTP